MPDNTPQTVEFVFKGEDGKETKVAVPLTAVHDAVRETHVPKANVEADFGRRLASTIKNQGLRKPEELLDDETFIGQVTQKHGLKKAGEADATHAQQMKAAVDRALADQETKVIAPLKADITKRQERELQYRQRDLERQILQAATPLAKDSMLKTPSKGKLAPIVALLRDNFAYDEQTNEFYQYDGRLEDGSPKFIVSTRGQSTYVPIDEFVASWFGQPENVDFGKGGQGGPNVGTGKGGPAGQPGSTGDVWLTEDEARDHQTYMKALDKVGGDYSRVKIRGQSQA